MSFVAVASLRLAATSRRASSRFSGVSTAGSIPACPGSACTSTHFPSWVGIGGDTAPGVFTANAPRAIASGATGSPRRERPPLPNSVVVHGSNYPGCP